MELTANVGTNVHGGDHYAQDLPHIDHASNSKTRGKKKRKRKNRLTLVSSGPSGTVVRQAL